MKIQEVKENLGSKVRYQWIEYIFSAYTLRVKNKKCYHQAELQDLKARSIRIVKLEDVEVVK